MRSVCNIIIIKNIYGFEHLPCLSVLKTGKPGRLFCLPVFYEDNSQAKQILQAAAPEQRRYQGILEFFCNFIRLAVIRLQNVLGAVRAFWANFSICPNFGQTANGDLIFT